MTLSTMRTQYDILSMYILKVNRKRVLDMSFMKGNIISYGRIEPINFSSRFLIGPPISMQLFD